MKLGRTPSIPDPRTLRLINYVEIDKLAVAAELLPESPARQMLHTNTTHPWPLLANDRLPCCASSSAGHMVHYWTEANGHLVLLTDQDIIAAHRALTGGAEENGVSMLNALKYWRNTGIGDHNIHSFVLAPQNRRDLKCVLHLFGSAYLGLNLPDFAYPTPLPDDPSTILAIPWEIRASLPPGDCEPREAKGHCVAAIGYDEYVVYIVTWGTLKTMSWEFYEKYTSESYAVLSHDWVSDGRLSPAGFDLAALKRDLQLITATGSS
jgi:hypothetical protein